MNYGGVGKSARLIDRRGARLSQIEAMEDCSQKKYKQAVMTTPASRITEINVSPAPAFLSIPLLPKGRIDNVLFRCQIGLRESEIKEDELFSLLSSPAAAAGVVFPSHFFEFSSKGRCLDKLEELALPFFVQISPGAELRDYFGELETLAQLSPNLKVAIELVFDRPLHAGDWALVRSLQDRGLSFRYVYCPTKEIDAAETVLSFPRELYPDLYFYFAPKMQRYDSLISSDEIIFLICHLRERCPEFQVRVVPHIYDLEPFSLSGGRGAITSLQELEKQFRKEPEIDTYLKNYAVLGPAKRIRQMALGLNGRTITAPFAVFFLWFLLLLRNPLEGVIAASVRLRNAGLFLGYFLRHCLRMMLLWARRSALSLYFSFRSARYRFETFRHQSWHQIYFFFHNGVVGGAFLLYLKMVNLFHLVRHALLLSFFFSRSVLTIGAIWARHAFLSVFWFGRKAYLEGSHHFVHGLLMACYRVRNMVHGLLMAYYWVRNNMVIIYYSFRNPMWAMEQRSPRLYRIIGHPLVKSFWFTKFQIEKRILRLHSSDR